jgi:hypothetical protein
MYATPIETLDALERAGYFSDINTATTIYLAGKIHRPILLEGPAGGGKTELAGAVARAYGVPLLRLQCYQGINEEKAIGQYDRSLQELYVLLMSKSDRTPDWAEIRREVTSRAYFMAGPLLEAIEQEKRCVLLIDEIDKVDYAFEAMLLELLSAWTLSIPKMGIEHNYERDGEIVIPAGSRAVGKITQADPSGLVNITFSSIEFAGGDMVPIEAVAADTSLEAIKGKVTGKQSGKSLMVRSLSGIGETAAMIVGAPSGNSAFSENDMLRMRLADNIGNAGDEQIMRMMTIEHIVVSVPAGTEIYLVFAKSQSVPASHETPGQVESASLPSNP